MKCNGSWTAKSVLRHAAICDLINEEILQMPSDQCRPELWMNDKFECIIRQRMANRICYTDGLKRNGFTVAGYFCEFPLLEVSIFTGSHATVYQTELYAISVLCESEVMKGALGKDICTDSQSAIEAISSPVVDSHTVRNCKTLLNEVGRSNKVTILWVSGHKGIFGAMRKRTHWQESELTKHSSDLNVTSVYRKPPRKIKVNKWLEKQHVNAWINYSEARHTKIFCKSPSKDFARQLLELNRPNIKRTVESITNHCGLNKYLYDIGMKDSPKCLYGHGDETGAHVILECIRYRCTRMTLLGKPELEQSDVDLASLDLEKLTNFLQRTNRLG